MKDKNQIRKALHDARGNLTYLMEVFGDQLAKTQKYKSGVDGLDAVRYYLIQKHNWLPRDVMTMSEEDLRFAMSEEMAGWKAPKGTL